MSEDPLGFAAGDSNLYRYCAGDPVNKTDPFGLTERWFFRGRAVNQSSTPGRYFTGHGAFPLPAHSSAPSSADVDAIQYRDHYYGVPGGSTVYVRSDGRVETAVPTGARYGELMEAEHISDAEEISGNSPRIPGHVHVNYISATVSSPPAAIGMTEGMGGTYLEAFGNYITGSTGHVAGRGSDASFRGATGVNPGGDAGDRSHPQPEGDMRPNRILPRSAIPSPAVQAAMTREWRDVGRRMRETHNWTRPDPHPQNYGYPKGGG